MIRFLSVAMVLTLLAAPASAGVRRITYAERTSSRSFVPAHRNGLQQASTSCVTNAVQAPWALIGTPTCVSNAAVSPIDRTASLDTWTNTGATHYTYQGAVVPASTVVTASAIVSKPSGTGVVGIAVAHASCAAPSCLCRRSDGGACVTAVWNATGCRVNVTDLTTTAIRAEVTILCGAVITAPTIYLIPGQDAVAVGTTNFGNVQVEAGLSALTFVPTTTAAASSSARPWR